MIYASEAKKQSIDFNSTVNKILEDISEVIRLASYKGSYQVDIIITDADVKDRYRNHSNTYVINCNMLLVSTYELENKIRGYGYDVMSDLRPVCNDKWMCCMSIKWK
jgi:hypothetical protein